jgi:hypothetical protein
MRTKPCPYCNGKGIVSAERDTLRMTSEEAAAMRAVAVRTPMPPPPEGEKPSVIFHLTDLLPSVDDLDDEAEAATPVVHVHKHDLTAILLALVITAVFIGGLAYLLTV